MAYPCTSCGLSWEDTDYILQPNNENVTICDLSNEIMIALQWRTFWAIARINKFQCSKT
jgi:hypothetical protein